LAFIEHMYLVACKKWNLCALHRLSNSTVSKMISIDHCSEGCLCWILC